MVKLNPIKMTPRESRLFANMLAEVEHNRATLEYVAMMSDVELPDEVDTEEKDTTVDENEESITDEE